MSYQKRVIIFITIIALVSILLLALFYMSMRNVFTDNEGATEREVIVPEDIRDEFMDGLQDRPNISD